MASRLLLEIVAIVLAVPTAALAQADAGPRGAAPDGGVPPGPDAERVPPAAAAPATPVPAPNPLTPWPAPNPLTPYEPSPPEAGPPAASPPPPYPAPPNLRWVLVDPNTMQPPPDPGFHQHDGFYMRMFLGLLAGGMHGDVATGELRISGQGFLEAFAFGHAIRENLILYGDYSIEVMPSASLGGPGKAPANVKSMPIMLTLAPGIAYYFEPSNVYLSFVLGLAITQADEDTANTTTALVEHRSKPGLGGNATVGKEWWVSANWGLGVALRGALARTREINTDYPWLYYSVAALFSATYN